MNVMLIVLLLASACFSQSIAWQSDNSSWPLHIIDNAGRGADGVRLGLIKGVLAITTGWEESGETKLYLHPGTEEVRKPWPNVVVGNTPSVEDAVFLPMQADYPVILSCCEGRERSIYVHERGVAMTSLLQSEWQSFLLSSSQQKMQWMFCVPFQLDEKNGLDLICAGKNENAAIGWFEAPENADDWENYAWHPLSPVGWVMSILVSDMDGDGDEDIVLSDRRGELSGCRWLENPGTEKLKISEWQNHFIGAKGQEVMFMTLADVNGDGLKDAVAAVKQDLLYYFQRLDNSGKTWSAVPIKFPDNTGTAKAVQVADMDLDGSNEFVVTCEHADAPKSGVFLLENLDNDFNTVKAVDISGPAGIKFDRIELVDLDDDGDLDILTCEERHANRGLGVIWYENPNINKNQQK